MVISKGIASGKLNPKVYRGQNAYANYIEVTEENLKNKKKTGTLKGP